MLMSLSPARCAAKARTQAVKPDPQVKINFRLLPIRFEMIRLRSSSSRMKL